MAEDTTRSAHGVAGAAAAVTTGVGTAAATTGSVVAGAVVRDATWALLAADTLECAADVEDVDDTCPLEPVLVWAETVVLSSAASLVVVADDDDDDDDDDEDDEAEAEAVAVEVEVVVEGDVVSSVACSVEGLDPADPAADDPLSPADVPSEAEPVEDEAESSARATPTSGAASDAPNSAALMPAEAAPICSHRRTPKFSDRRARCPPRFAAAPPAIS
ncbi:hypothetical protein [Mycobacterium sp. AT1]|uniref:hypothetical protein n=1 Tax=Mycobacterium sp. AT1 TaxID=1961706 RepID=UPI0011514D02|nr:hypothetical protein [Mycobacterium sp. AT1]